MPNMYTGCTLIDSLLLSTLECFYSDKECFLVFLKYMHESVLPLHLSYPFKDIHPLNYIPTSTRFTPSMTVKAILKEMLVAKWNASFSYRYFYESCLPSHCIYSDRIRTKSISEVFMILLSTIGGLSVSLRLITPVLAKITFSIIARLKRRRIETQQKMGEF